MAEPGIRVVPFLSQEDDPTENLSITRTGAGLTFVEFESHAQILLAYGAVFKDYNQLPAQRGLGQLGLSAVHFVSGGENSLRGAIDDSPSLTTYRFSFSEGQSAPAATIFSLFDSGLAESDGPSTSRDPLSYRFTTTLDGNTVSTHDRSLQVADPYVPVGNSKTTHLRNEEHGMLHVNNYTDSLGANFPDNIALLQTGSQHFDSLAIGVESLAFDPDGEWNYRTNFARSRAFPFHTNPTLGFISPDLAEPKPGFQFWLRPPLWKQLLN